MIRTMRILCLTICSRTPQSATSSRDGAAFGLTLTTLSPRRSRVGVAQNDAFDPLWHPPSLPTLMNEAETFQNGSLLPRPHRDEHGPAERVNAKNQGIPQDFFPCDCTGFGIIPWSRDIYEIPLPHKLVPPTYLYPVPAPTKNVYPVPAQTSPAEILISRSCTNKSRAKNDIPNHVKKVRRTPMLCNVHVKHPP